MSKKGGAEVPVVQYYMSLQYGICAGEVETLWQIKVNEKTAWIGGKANTGTFEIDKEELFGGIKKEGGVKGTVCWQVGDFDQVLDDRAAAKHGTTSDNLPGYRGVATAYFIESEDSDNPGFYWSANQPYVAAAAFRITRLDREWNPAHASIGDQFAITPWQEFKETIVIDPDDFDSPYVVFNEWNNVYHHRYEYTATRGMYPLETDASTHDADHTGWTHTGIEGIDIRAARGSYDVDDFYPGEVAICETPGVLPGDLITVEFQHAPGRYFAFQIIDDDYGFNGVIGIGHQAGFGWSCRYLGYEFETLTGNSDFEPEEESEIPQVDANPAHIIRECITNPLWGLGLPEAVIDDDSFSAAAATLFTEQFGLSMIWTRQAPVEDFVREVQDHINAMVFVRPSSGLYELKLIRDDYDPDDLPEFDASNATLASFSRRSPAEVVNEIQVTWTNPTTEQEEVYTLQDLGSIVANLGEIVSDNRNYYGVRRRSLAATLAARDISALTAPLASAEIVVDRTAYDLAPGDVLKLTWPEVATATLIMRVMGVNYGRPGDSKIALSLTEDIFAYARPAPVEPPESESDPLTSNPQPPDPVEAVSMPRYFVQKSARTLSIDEAAVAIFAASDVLDTDSVELYGEKVNSSGTVYIGSLGTRSVIAQAQIADAWDFEAESLAGPFLNYTAGSGPFEGGFGLVGEEGLPEDEHEIVNFVSRSLGVWTVRRGCLDTIPREWPIHTPIRFFRSGATVADLVDRAIGVELDYQVKARTSRGLSTATAITYTPTDRYQAPARPANCLLGITEGGTLGTTFEDYQEATSFYTDDPYPGGGVPRTYGFISHGAVADPSPDWCGFGPSFSIGGNYSDGGQSHTFLADDSIMGLGTATDNTVTLEIRRIVGSPHAFETAMNAAVGGELIYVRQEVESPGRIFVLEVQSVYYDYGTSTGYACDFGLICHFVEEIASAGTGLMIDHGEFDATSGVDNINVEWAHRNRITEETVVLAWDGASVTPEDDQTTTLTLIDDSDDSVIDTITGLSGTSYTIPRADFGSARIARVRFSAERDGFESIQSHEISVRLSNGYGSGYGGTYGA